MKRISLLLLLPLLLALLFVGCPVRSLFPLFTDKDVAFNPALVGTWAAGSDQEQYVFRAVTDKSYLVSVLDKKGDTVSYRAQLGKLGASWFLDTRLDERSEDYHMLASHLIHRVWLSGDSLHIATMEGDWLKKMAESKKLRIPYVNRDGDIVLIAQTSELQKFVMKYADNTDAFPVPPGAFVRVK